MAYFQLEISMLWRGRGTHNDAAMAVGFDTPFHFRQFRIGQKLGPTTQIKGRLLRARPKFKRHQRHNLNLPHPYSHRQSAQDPQRCPDDAPKKGKSGQPCCGLTLLARGLG
jgi:hypothetical protein